MQLTESQIIELGKKTGNALNAHTDVELLEEPVRAEIHLGLVVTKDAMLNPEIEQLQKTVPDEEIL